MSRLSDQLNWLGSGYILPLQTARHGYQKPLLVLSGSKCNIMVIDEIKQP